MHLANSHGTLISIVYHGRSQLHLSYGNYRDFDCILLYKNFEQARGEKKCRGIATPSVKLLILSNLCLWYSMGQSEAIGHSNDNSNNRGFLK